MGRKAPAAQLGDTVPPVAAGELAGRGALGLGAAALRPLLARLQGPRPPLPSAGRAPVRPPAASQPLSLAGPAWPRPAAASPSPPLPPPLNCI